jgi:hypothetical protein
LSAFERITEYGTMFKTVKYGGLVGKLILRIYQTKSKIVGGKMTNFETHLELLVL